jgi:hypothetical protein
MYKIIGGNGVEYGPVSADEVRRWVTEGRANGQTLARAEGAAEWKPISSFSEFADTLAIAPKPGRLPATDEPAASRALQLVNGPSIGLMVTAAAGFIGVVILGIGVAMAHNGYDFSQAPTMNPAVLEVLKGKIGLIMCAVGLPGSAFILFGAIQARKLKNYGVCFAASIVAMVPYVSFCFYIGLPLGIWALVVFCRADVKSCFK